ncbi:DUF4062 domain-containing protein [Dyadobacter jiangsuensis]|uniref:DUF4062 domain-containing protein n=1 Tax=Dyadobacter jiangsuensis TaxID=1591085 RepID=A0A2P8GF53_9BACT|nr:DUF4062 domain-containing protein [Dyadobacter jiangsuensis]PSL32599.1 hypothetical protein CLV60_102317 [Dyadobacter jiangsuensis]
MPYTAQVFNVMLASPSDVAEERKVAREVILEWNNVHSQSRKIVLMPIGWEYNAVPEMGDRPQEIINKQLLTNADILIGIFWTRIGTSTGKAVSGTVEEIENHINSNRPTLLYFSNKPVNPDTIDAQQHAGVKSLKQEFQPRGLSESFNSLDDFKSKLQRQLATKLNESEYIEIVTNVQLPIPNPTPLMSDSAKLLLKECALDEDGEIYMVNYIGGFELQTNNKKINTDNSARTLANFQSAIKELQSLGLIHSIGTQGTGFRITAEGYNLADKINNSDI